MFAVILIMANTLGAIPFILSIALKSGINPSAFSKYAANPDNLGFLRSSTILGFIIMVFPFVAGLIAFVLLVRPLNDRTIGMTINGGVKFRWNRFFISGAVWLALSGLYFFSYLKADPANFSINNKTSSLIILSLVTILLIPFQAAFEEVLFRGYLMQGFAALIRNRWFPLVMTSVLFGLLHAFNPEVKAFGFLTMMPQYIVFGLIFGIITINDDGIEAAMGAHTANNAFLCIMVTSPSSTLQTPALYLEYTSNPWPELAVLLLSGIIFIFILKIIFKWEKMSLLFEKIKVTK